MIPRNEHPDPQAERARWMNLNGEWELENADGVTLSTVISDGKTEITLSTREGRTEEITLGKILQ